MLCKYGKIKLQLTDYQLTAILRSSLGGIRTPAGGTRIRRATITPQGNQLFLFVISSLGVAVVSV